MGKDETGTTFTDKFTLAAKGDYSLYLTRSGSTTKQEVKAITVASSGYISMSLAIPLVLFLFLFF